MRDRASANVASVLALARLGVISFERSIFTITNR